MCGIKMASSKEDMFELLYCRKYVHQIQDSDNENIAFYVGDTNEKLERQGDAHKTFNGDRDKLDILNKLDEDPYYQGPGTDQVETWTNLNLRGLGCRIPDSIARCKNLRVLDVSNNSQLDKEEIVKICRLETVEELNMSNSSITTITQDINIPKHLTKLNLSQNQLTELPLQLFNHVKLEELDLIHNNIAFVTPQVELFCNLRKLNLSNNPLGKFPLEVCNIKTLENISLAHTGITTVPREITLLGNLKGLSLSSNCLKEFSSPLCELAALETLDISRNSITTVPPTLKQLQHLNKLDLSYNKLTALPLPVCGLVTLETLNLLGNNITAVPPEIALLKNLKELNLSQNKLEELPLPVCELVTLETLELRYTHITTVPAEISQLRNLKKLNLSANMLEELPLPVCELVTLETLELRYTHITTVPAEISRLKNLKRLKLSFNNLEELPLPVCELVTLETLELREIHITTVKPQISQLQNLKELNLSQNKLEELPLSVCDLVTLETLDLLSNYITKVPPEISQLKNLKQLNLSQNKLEELPLSVCELVTLETLSLWEIHITAVPPEISQLKYLKELNLSFNNLEELPSPVCELVTLETLDLSSNHITTMPPQEHVTQLKKLKELNLSYNWLKELPLPVCQLKTLETLDLMDNDITTMPPEITQLKNLKELNLKNKLMQPPQEVADRGKEAVFRYFDDLIRTKATTSSRLQVHILGEICVGKTSLVKTLTSGTPFLTSMADRTHVMEQIAWSPKEDVFLNINDFGGHEVYRVAHNFFITEEALTLIVFNLQDVSSKYIDTITSWIDNVYSRAPDSTILLVGTHADCLSNEQELDARKKKVLCDLESHLRDKASKLRTSLEELEKRTEFKSSYAEAFDEKMTRIKRLIENPPRVEKSVFVTSSQTGYGMAELKEELIRTAQVKKLTLPEAWLQKVEQIERAKQNGQDPFLTLDSLDTMTKKTPPQMQGDGDAQRIEDVLNFLHATGVVLWFRDNPLLKTYVFHRQEVFIDILRAVLCEDIDSTLVYNTNPFNMKYSERKFESAKEDVLRRGIVSKTMLECLWWRFNFGRRGLEAMLELLENFEICYLVKGADENRYHFPWLLTEDRPKCISSKCPSVPSKEKLQISTEIHFPTACPPGLYEMAAVHLHSCLGHYKSTRQDWKDGFYAELDSQFQMWFERRLSGRSPNGVLRLFIRGEDPIQLKKHILVIFQDLVDLVERECPGSPRDEYVVCPHCVREEKNPPTLFDAPKFLLSVPLEEPAPYHPCPEEDPNTLASPDFFYPVTKGKMTAVHCTSLDKHANHTVKIIRGTFNSLHKILSRLGKTGILTEEEKAAILEPDADDRLLSFLKGKNDSAFFIFCGALHDSGHAQMARMLRLPDLAMELSDVALGDVLQRLLDRRVISTKENYTVRREPTKALKVIALLKKLREGKRDDEAESAFIEFGKALDEEIAKRKNTY
ncbi:malignant fibrous histiocytoma-amplified sequence 1 homolog [Lingula anatina]|uniref:non-specific serine/threonine protein kinase n=1 Tax=Lingula anatina TaxID=7574 RepID=A0A1S3JX14_LINAN|nr:malignant fibrous histiocytoma-amplified sequence 1 homolog [Lingula anatina]|eukprot:XP_013414975.1 malignant fibrous histiocytoma-amplified sequence 1 homolog [Lingula anatina]